MTDPGQAASVWTDRSFLRDVQYKTDVNLAGWPDAVYLIASLADPDAPDLKGFWIRDGEIAEAELVVG